MGEAGVAGNRLRQRARRGHAVETGSDDNELDAFRRQLLESDSSDSDAEGGSLKQHKSDAPALRSGTSSEVGQSFQWSMLRSDTQEGTAALGPPSRRRLLN